MSQRLRPKHGQPGEVFRRWLWMGLLGCLVVSPVRATQTHLMDYQGFEAYVEGPSPWCSDQVQVRLVSPRATDFEHNDAALDRLLGGLRAAMGFECARVKRIGLNGVAKGKVVYRGHAAAADGWRLHGQYLAELPAQPSTQASVPAPVSPPAAPAHQTAAAPRPQPQHRLPVKAQAPLLPASPSSAPVKPQTLRKPATQHSGYALWIWGGLLGLAIVVALLILLRLRRKPVDIGLTEAQEPEPRTQPAETRSSPQAEEEDIRIRVQRAANKVAPAAAGSGKQDLLATQKAKYQARVTEAMDLLGQLEAEYQSYAGQEKEMQKALQKIAENWQAQTRKALKAAYGGAGKALLRALVLVPIWQLFVRLPRLAKIALVILLISALYTPLRALIAWRGLYAEYWLVHYGPAALLCYAVAVPILFFIGWRASVAGPFRLMRQHLAGFKKLELDYLCAWQGDQQSSYSALAVSTFMEKDNQPFTLEIELDDDQANPNLAGAFLLRLSDGQHEILAYRLPGEGLSGQLFRWNEDNAFMKQHGQILVDALRTMESGLVAPFANLEAMARILWKTVILKNDIPRIQGLLENIQTLESIWRTVSIEDAVFDFLLKRIDLFNLADKAVPAGILLYGYPGNGKQHLARLVARSVGAEFVQLSASDLRDAGSVGAVWDKYSSQPGTVLFVDQADHLFPKLGSEQAGGESKEVAMAWCEAWDRIDTARQRVWVVLSATNERALNPLVLSRLGSSRIEIKSPGEAGRRLILAQACEEHEIRAKIPDSVIHNTNGASVKDLLDIVAEVRLQCYPNPPDESHWKAAITHVRGSDAMVRDETKTWERLILPGAIKDQLKTITKVLRQAERFKEKGIEAPKGLLLFGPPGTGKTEIARTLANESGLRFLTASTADLKAPYIGQSGQRVAEVFARARANAPCILFIDEIETVATDRNSSHADSFTNEIVTQMLQEMDGVQKNERPVFVLAATNIPEAIDSAVMSRLRTKLEIPLPDLACRQALLKQLLSSMPSETSFDLDVASAELARMLRNKSGRDLKVFVHRAVEREIMRRGDNLDNFDLTLESLMEEARETVGENEFRDPSKTWDRLIIPEETKDQLKTITRMLTDGEALQKKGVNVPAGMLLFGPPGTGKTEIARTLANEGGLQFISVATADMKAGYVGQSGQMVKQVFAKARAQAPCILFIDEFESIAAKRGASLADQFTQEIVTQMLIEIDGVRHKGKEALVFILAATNLPETIDPAIASRLTVKVEVPLPDQTARARILRGMLGDVEVAEGLDIDAAADDLAKRLKGKSGRDLKNLVNRAMSRAVLRSGGADGLALTLDDLMAEANPQGKEVSAEDLAKIWSQIVLPSKVRDSIVNKIRMFNQADPAAPRGLLLYGPSGTGKTEIARKIADSASCHFMPLSIPDLKAGHVGGSGERVRKVWEEARSRGRAVIFVDECEGMFARRGSSDSDAASNELVQAFLAEWDGVSSSGQIWVVGATNRRDLLDDAIISRFGATVEVGLPDADARQRILKLEMEKLGREPEVPAHIGKATSGFSGRNLSTLARDMCTLAAEKGELTDADWDTAVAQQTTAGSDKVAEDARWDALVIAEDTLEQLKTICDMLQHTETLKAQGINPPSGMLLYGPPGTGKTQIARTLANESGIPFIAAATADLKAGYLGQSGQKVKALFERARSRAPSILFIDEMESVAPDRNGPASDQYTQEIVTQMLQELDGVKANAGHVFLLAATNIPDAIDPAILSRLREKLEVPLPGLEERERLFRLFLAGFQHVEFDRQAAPAQLAERYDGLSGRDLRGVVDKAQQSAVRRAFASGTPERVVLNLTDLGLEPDAASAPKAV